MVITWSNDFLNKTLHIWDFLPSPISHKWHPLALTNSRSLDSTWKFELRHLHHDLRPFAIKPHWLQALFLLALVFHELNAILAWLGSHFVGYLLQQLIQCPRESSFSFFLPFDLRLFTPGDTRRSSTDFIGQILAFMGSLCLNILTQGVFTIFLDHEVCVDRAHPNIEALAQCLLISMFVHVTIIIRLAFVLTLYLGESRWTLRLLLLLLGLLCKIMDHSRRHQWNYQH